MLHLELANKGSYKVSIGNIRLTLQKLEETNSEAEKLRQKRQKGYQNINKVFHHQGLSFMPKAIQTELASYHHNELLPGHFSIKKI